MFKGYILLLAIFGPSANAFVPPGQSTGRSVAGPSTLRQSNHHQKITTALCVIKRGKKVNKDMGSSGGGVGMQPSNNMGSQINWCPLPYTPSELPSEDGTINVLETNLPTLKNGATNPAGAVSVAKFNGATYCFSISCPQCKIPLLKAKLIEGPRVCCSFCKSTYNLKTGEKVEAAETGGLVGGIVKNLFSSVQGGPLPVYRLGEKAGKILIAVD